MTRVRNIRGLDHRALQQDPGFVYVGRGNRLLGYKGHVLQNPYKVRKDSPFPHRLDAVRNYAHRLAEVLGALEDVYEGVEILDFARGVAYREAIAGCRGKTLGCWCTDYEVGGPVPPVPCHAVVVARLCEGLEPLPPEWGY